MLWLLKKKRVWILGALGVAAFQVYSEVRTDDALLTAFEAPASESFKSAPVEGARGLSAVSSSESSQSPALGWKIAGVGNAISDQNKIRTAALKSSGAVAAAARASASDYRDRIDHSDFPLREIQAILQEQPGLGAEPVRYFLSENKTADTQTRLTALQLLVSREALRSDARAIAQQEMETGWGELESRGLPLVQVRNYLIATHRAKLDSSGDDAADEAKAFIDQLQGVDEETRRILILQWNQRYPAKAEQETTSPAGEPLLGNPNDTLSHPMNGEGSDRSE